jgi:mannosyltransferase
MYTHNLAIFGIIAPDFYFLVKLDWTKLRTLILIQIFIGLFSIPWLVILPGQMQKIQAAFWTPKPGIDEVFQSIILLTSHLPLTPSWLLFVCSLLSIEGFMLVFFIAWKYKKEMPLVQLLLILVLGPPITLFMISYLARPVFVSRVFIYSATMFLGIAGIAIAKGWNKRIGLVLASLFVLNSALSLPSLYSYSEFPRSPYKEAANFLATNEDSNLRIIHDNKLSYFPMHYYLPDRDQVFLADEPGSSNDTFAVASQQAMEIFPVNNIEDAVNGTKRIAFVVFSSAIEEYNERGMDQHPILKWLNDEFNFQEKTTFNDLEIYFFDR